MEDAQIIAGVKSLIEQGELFLDIVRLASQDLCFKCVITMPEYLHYLKTEKDKSPSTETVRYWVTSGKIDAFIVPKEQALTQERYLIVLTERTKNPSLRSYQKRT